MGYSNGSSFRIPARRTTNGTTPAGSQWTRNPIPESEKYFPAPFAGGSGKGPDLPFQLVDDLQLPADLAIGDYVLSWRWDCEHTSQVWTYCGDVTIVGKGPIPTPGPSPVPAPTPAPTPLPSPTPAPTPAP